MLKQYILTSAFLPPCLRVYGISAIPKIPIAIILCLYFTNIFSLNKKASLNEMKDSFKMGMAQNVLNVKPPKSDLRQHLNNASDMD